MENLEKFQESLLARGVSQRTIEAYIGDLKVLSSENILSRDGINGALAKMREAGASAATVCRRMSALRAFFRWRESTGCADPDPTKGLVVKMASRFEPVVLTDEEAGRLLSTIRESRKKSALRDLAMITLMLRRGLRVSEVAGLNFEDIDYDRDHFAVWVDEKGGKRSRKPLGKSAEDALCFYLQTRRIEEEEAGTETRDRKGPIFLSNEGSRISVGQVEQRVRFWVGEAGISKNVTPHSLRHTFATALNRKTNNLKLVQEMLGHANIATTARYAHIAQGDMERALED